MRTLPALCPLLSALCLFSGCRIPDGTNVTTSGVGLIVEPFGSAPQAPKAAVGSFSNSFSLPAPAEAGPTINRIQVRAPGVDHTSTVTQGPVGQEMQAAGDVLPKSLEALHGPGPALFPGRTVDPGDE